MLNNAFRSSLPCCFSFLCLFVLTFCAAGLHAAPLALTVVAGEGTVLDGAAAAYYSFGTRTLSDDAPLVHVFLLRNEAALPITIDRLQSSCGCTTAAAGDSNTLPLTVAPGQTVPIRIQVSLRRLLAGETHKSVWVYTHGTVDATTRLEIRGAMQEDAPSAAQSKSASALEAGSPAPMLTGTDTQDRTFALSARHGHPVALLFFCGCPWCAAAARSWSQVQHAGMLPPGTQTVVIFDGDRAAVRAFAAANKLDLKRTTLLPDPDARMTEGIYKVNSCPRVFALDAFGIIKYTNTHIDDQPRQATARTLADRLQTSLAYPR